MNRRSILKAAVGACAALLLPWRKTKAGPSWARVVDFVPSEHKYSCPRNKDGVCDQTLRIQQILEWRYIKLKKPTGKLADLEATTYTMGVIRHFEMPLTRVVLELGEHIAGVVDIDDSVAASMNDSKLSGQLIQAFLLSLHKREMVCIDAFGSCIRDRDQKVRIDKLGSLSKT